jgi:hypothetical protein
MHSGHCANIQFISLASSHSGPAEKQQGQGNHARRPASTQESFLLPKGAFIKHPGPYQLVIDG